MFEVGVMLASPCVCMNPFYFLTCSQVDNEPYPTIYMKNKCSTTETAGTPSLDCVILCFLIQKCLSETFVPIAQSKPGRLQVNVRINVEIDVIEKNA